MYGISEILQKVTFETMSKAESSSYTLEVSFSQSSAGINLTPISIEGMSIDQQFVTNVFDVVMMTCNFYPLDLLKLLENTQDLKVTIIQRRWDRDIYGCHDSELPDIYTFNAIIANPADIMKTLPPAVFKKTQLEDYDRDQLNKPLPLTVQLATDDELSVKRKQINSILADTDTNGVVLYALSAIGVENVHMEEIQNEKKYRNVIIPPMTDVATLFSYLQKEYGLCKQGISQYFTNNTMYIYQPFNTKPERNDVVNVFRLPENSVDGGDMYHVVEGEDLYIACFSKVASNNPSDAATENVGNAVVVKQADTSMDASANIDNKGKLTKNEQSTIIAKVNNQNTTMKDQVQAKYCGTTANIFEQLSNITASQMEHVGIGWIHAKPYLIKPGMKCILHYDDANATDVNDVYTTSPGIVSGVNYQLVQQAKYPTIVYRWDAKLLLSLAPKPKPNATETSSNTTSAT